MYSTSLLSLIYHHLRDPCYFLIYCLLSDWFDCFLGGILHEDEGWMMD